MNMDRKTQIEFATACEGRVRSHVSKWLHDPAVQAALERRPIEDRHDDGPTEEPRRKFG
jgi:hypothetical protein